MIGTTDEMAQPAQTRRRPAGAAVLAIPLLAVLVLAGVGTAASLRDGSRAERVRGLAPFNEALTTLVQQLQRERSLSVAGETGDDAVQRLDEGLGGVPTGERRASDRRAEPGHGR